MSRYVPLPGLTPLCRFSVPLLLRPRSGFSASSHGERLLKEVRNGCAKPARGKPGNIQRLASYLLATPDHQGIALALNEFSDLVETKADGFGEIKSTHATKAALLFLARENGGVYNAVG